MIFNGVIVLVPIGQFMTAESTFDCIRFVRSEGIMRIKPAIANDSGVGLFFWSRFGMESLEAGL